MKALLLPTGCSSNGSVEGTTQLTMLAAAGGLWSRQINLQLSEVLTAATGGSIQIMPAALSSPLMNLRTLHNQTGTVVLHSPPDAVKRAIEGSLEVWGEPVARIQGITALFPIPPLNTYWIVSKLSGLTRLDDLPKLDVAWLVLEHKGETLNFEHYLNEAGLRAGVADKSYLSDCLFMSSPNIAAGGCCLRNATARHLAWRIGVMGNLATRIV